MSDEPISVNEISKRLAAKAEDFAVRVLGMKPTTRTSRELRFFPKGGLSLTIRGAKAGQWTNYGGGEFGDLLDLYEWHNNTSKLEAIQYAKGFLGISDEQPLPEFDGPSQEEMDEELAKEEAKRLRTARWLWEKSVRPKQLGPNTVGQPVFDYLKSRGLQDLVKDGLLPPSIRYRKIGADELKYVSATKEDFPEGLDAVVFGSTDDKGEISAVQSILVYKGKKAPLNPAKVSNGLLQGATVKLGEIEDTLILSEGPETGLSAYLSSGIATWITLGRTNYTRFEVPARVKTIIIAVDIDESTAGLAAALDAASYWRDKGKVVKFAMPDYGDLNDILQESGPRAVNDCIENAVMPNVAPEDQSGDFLILTKKAWDAFALWISTGAKVKAAINGVRPDRPNQLSDEIRSLLIVGNPDTNLDGSEVLLSDKIRPDHLKEVRILSMDVLPMHSIYRELGEFGVLKLINNAVELGQDQLSGHEQLLLSEGKRIFIHQTRASARSGRIIFPDDISLAIKPQFEKLGEFDWSIIKDKNVYIVPTNSQPGTHSASCMISYAVDHEAKTVHLVEFPLFSPSADSYKINHTILPEHYSMDSALQDGWNYQYSEDLLRLSTPFS